MFAAIRQAIKKNAAQAQKSGCRINRDRKFVSYPQFGEVFEPDRWLASVTLQVEKPK